MKENWTLVASYTRALKKVILIAFKKNFIQDGLLRGQCQPVGLAQSNVSNSHR